jgi:hypothetical protein
MHALGLLAEFLEHLIETRNLVLRLFQVILETLREIAVGGFIDQLRQRFHYLVLGVIDVFETVQQQVIHRFDVFGEQTHGALRRRALWRRESAPPAVQRG